MQKFIAGTTEIGAVVEKPPTREGRQLIMILSPRGSGANKPKPAPAKPASAPSASPASAPAKTNGANSEVTTAPIAEANVKSAEPAAAE
jgi:hypothetical protein